MTDPGSDLFRSAVNVPGKVFVGGQDVRSPGAFAARAPFG